MHNCSRLTCRIDDAAAPEVMVTALGEADTPLSQGSYEPASDRFVGNDGRIVEHYYRDRLGITFFQPLAADAAPPPPGWCTWAYYGRDVTPAEVLVNARWIASNLREYGVRLILIDDGWQGDNRDWTVSRRTFPGGMKQLADELRGLELLPGLWICPFGQDNERLVRESGVFMFHEDGRSVCGTMGGPYTLDPTKPGALAFVEQLMRRVTNDWGYGHIKLDGVHSQSLGYGVLEAYKQYRQHFSDPAVDAVTAFRQLLQAILQGTGPGVSVGGCLNCREAIGLCHTMRSAADVHNEWHNGFVNAVTSTMRGYYLHRIGWYNDPDYCMLGAPLTFPMAQAWATLFGVTGQFLLFADRMPDLPESRVELIKRISPPAPIRPFDLFPTDRRKSVYDLKVNLLGRQYDVVAVFNHDERAAASVFLDFARLGLEAAGRYHVYDYWNAEHLGVCEGGVFVEVGAAACRLITLQREGRFPVLLSTSRHVVQGWPDLEELRTDAEGGFIRGVSRLVGGERYCLTFGLPMDKGRSFALRGFRLSSGEPVDIRAHRGSVEVSWTSCASGASGWEAQFAACGQPVALHDGAWPYMIGARDIDPWTVELFWMSFGSPAAFFVKQDGRLLGYTFSNRAVVGKLEPRACRFEVGVADVDGTRFSKTNAIVVTPGESLPPVICLSDLPWDAATSGYRLPRRDRAVGGGGLTTGGRRYSKGIGTFPHSRIACRLEGRFARLRGACGIEDQNGAPEDRPPEARGTAVFRVLGDGRELMPRVTRLHRQEAYALDLDVSNVQVLELLVEPPEGETEATRSFAPHANWLDMRISAGQEEE